MPSHQPIVVFRLFHVLLLTFNDLNQWVVQDLAEVIRVCKNPMRVIINLIPLLNHFNHLFRELIIRQFTFQIHLQFLPELEELLVEVDTVLEDLLFSITMITSDVWLETREINGLLMFLLVFAAFLVPRVRKACVYFR